MSSADGEAVDHGDDGFWKPPDLHLHIEHVEARNAVFAHIATFSFHVHIAAGAESLVARTRQQYHADVLRFATIGKGLPHLPCREWGECVAIARTIDSYLSDAAILLEAYLLKMKAFDGFPFSFFHIVCLYLDDVLFLFFLYLLPIVVFFQRFFVCFGSGKDFEQ